MCNALLPHHLRSIFLGDIHAVLFHHLDPLTPIGTDKGIDDS